MTAGGLRALIADAPNCVCPDGRDLCGGGCCDPDQVCDDTDTCTARTCKVCEIEQDGQCYAVLCDPGQVCVNDVCVAGDGSTGGGDIGLACPPDWLDCQTFCCPPGDYYCGGGCCFDPAVPCFPEVPKAWPTLGS